EAADHRALNDEVELAERRRRALPLQDLEIVAVERLVLLAIALGDHTSDPLANRTAPRAVRVAPREAVVPARCADDSLRVRVDARAAVLLRGVLLLGFDVASAQLDRIELVLANAAVQNLLSTGEGAAAPLAS